MGYNLCNCGKQKASHANQCRNCVADSFTFNKNITKEQIAWVAGILEGEGSWSINKNRNYWQIVVDMTDLDTIQRLKEYTGVGTIGVKSKETFNRKKAYYWAVSAKKQKVWLTNLVKPWLSARRLEKIHKIMGD